MLVSPKPDFRSKGIYTKVQCATKMFLLFHSAPMWSLGSLFDNLKDDCLAAILEFIGTTFFLVLGFGGIQASSDASRSSSSASSSSSVIEQVLYISTCMGLSLLVSAWLFFRVTGSLFNPNISLALLLVGILPPVRFVLYTIAQLAGAIAAAAIVSSLTPGPVIFK